MRFFKSTVVILGFVCLTILTGSATAQDCRDEDNCEKAPANSDPVTGLAGGLAGLAVAGLVGWRIRKGGTEVRNASAIAPVCAPSLTGEPATSPPQHSESAAAIAELPIESPSEPALSDLTNAELSPPSMREPDAIQDDTYSPLSEADLSGVVDKRITPFVMEGFQDRAEPAVPGETKTGLGKITGDTAAIIAIALYALLADTAIETFVDGSQLRWAVAALVAAYSAITILRWRRQTWPERALDSSFVFLALLTGAAWWQNTGAQGLSIARLPQSIPFELASAAAILGAALLLTKGPSLRGAFKWAVWILAGYGTCAFLAGVIRGSDYASLFHGYSLWTGAPNWLQGAFLGAFVVVPVALLSLLVVGVGKGLAARERGWAYQPLALAMSMLMASSALRAPTDLASRGIESRSANPAGASGPDESRATNPGNDPQFARLEALRSQVNAAELDIPARAAVLGHDPERIFNFVRDEITFEAYAGVLRGARGTLLGKAGNALDKSLLLAELLKASGVTTQFAAGVLDLSKVQTLVSEANASKKTTAAPANPPDVAAAGVADTGGNASEIFDKYEAVKQDMDELKQRVGEDLQIIKATLRDKQIPLTGQLRTTDSQVINSARRHVWVQMRKDNKWIGLDPSFVAARTGDQFAPVASIYSEIPDTLKQTLTFRVKIEQKQDSGLRVNTLVEARYAAADLTSASITFENLPIARGTEDLKGIVERATTFLPILRVDGKDIYRDGFDTNGNVIPTLQLTSLNPAGPAMGALTGALDRAFDGGRPAGGVLTAEWLEIVSTIPGETDRVYEREILDRIGVENRTSGAKKDLKPGYQDDKRLRYLLATQQSILIETAFFGSAFVVDSVISTTQRRSTMLAASRAATPASPRYDDAWNNELSTELLALSTTAKGLGDQLVAREYPNARFYHARPGILTFKTKLDIATDGDIVIQRGFDIVENTMRTVSPDGRTSLPELALALGVIETHAERILASDFNESLFNALADPSDAPAEFGDVIQPVSVVDLFEAGRKAGISSVVVGPGRLGNFAQLNVSPEGTERIRQDVSHGYVVLAPRANVEMGGRSTIGWWRIDPVTGTTLGMMESGEGQAATEYSTVNSNRGAQIVSLLKFLGKTACVFLTVAGLLSIALLAYNIATGQVELNEQLAASLAVGMVLGQITGSACNRLFKRQGRCFAAGTPVQVALRPGVGSENGILSFVRGTEEITTRPIEQIAPGDLVLSRGEYSQTTKLKRVLRTTRRVAPEVLTLTLAQTAGGQVVERITTTPEHLFYVSTQGFVEARQLGIGTSIVTRAGPSLTISAIQRLHRAEGYKVYNLEVEEDHTYFAGRTGLWVHNRYRFTKVNPAKFPKGEKQGVQDTISAIKKNPNQAEANWWSRTKTREPKWGSPYKNRGIIDPATGEPRPGTQLPAKDSTGKPITYKEYDVRGDTKASETDAGARRIIVGSDGKTYYTNTHYGDQGDPAFVEVPK